MVESELAARVWSKENLHKAWLKVSSSSRTSASRTIRREAEWFGHQVLAKINSLCSRLSMGIFEFSPSKGIFMQRAGKSDRPIVVAPIENKIVQRAILNVVNNSDSLSQMVKTQFSFGGIYDTTDRRNVGTAVDALRGGIEAGLTWYVKSDIRDFFVGIPREKVVDAVRSRVSDEKFLNLFERAVAVELDNMIELGADAEAFPIHETGVAQGCCLSPFIGNALLKDFDRKMNDRGVRCLRYIDDFLILAPSRGAALGAFKAAKKLLSGFGLSVHDPEAPNSKTKVGSVTEGIEFLGVEVRGKVVRPSNESRVRLLQKIKSLVNESVATFGAPSKGYAAGVSLSRTLRRIDGTITGWVGQYKFCNDQKVLASLNKSIDEQISKYLRAYGDARKRLQANDRRASRELLGVRYLVPEDWSNR